MAWLTGWNYRKPVTISNSGSTLTDYQILITIDTAALVTAGKLLSSCNDIRFSSSDGSTLLNYWIESGCNTTSTKIWIKIPSIVTGSNTIYFYYNNTGALPASNGTNTFIFFDDFSGDLSKWTVSGNSVITSGELVITGSGSWGTNAVLGNIALARPFILEWTEKAPQNAVDAMFGYAPNVSPHTGAYFYKGVVGSNKVAYYVGNIYGSTTYTSAYENDKLVIKPTQGYEWYSNETLFGTYTSAGSDTNWYPMFQIYTSGQTLTVDNVRARKYASPEPTTCIGGEEVSTVSWLTGWSKRKALVITGSTSGAQTDYQTKLTVHKSTGTDTSTDIYLGTNVKDDFSDVRFTSSNGSTTLNYWIESYVFGSSATVWIKIPSIPISPCTTTIYLYYNNLSATSSSSGTSTFDFFDDFSGDLSKWTVSQSSAGNVQIISGEVSITGNNNWNVNGITSINNISRPSVIEWKSRTSTTTLNTFEGYSTQPLSYTSGLQFHRHTDGNIYRSLDGSYAAWYGWSSSQTTQKIILKPTQGYTIFWDGIQKEDNSSWATNNDKIAFQIFNTGAYLYVDDVIVRKYASPEPAISAIGTEEIEVIPANITATLMTVTPSESPCRTGICTVTVNVTWTNTGGTEGSFVPNITIDTVAVPPQYPSQVLGAGATVTKSFLVTDLTADTHAICPYPN